MNFGYVTVNGVNSNEDSYRLTDRFLFVFEYVIIYIGNICCLLSVSIQRKSGGT